MCYSAMVEQSLKTYGFRYKAKLRWPLFEETFRKRASDDSVRIARALDANFESPTSPEGTRIKAYIDAYRARKTQELETELFKQKKRLTDSERALGVKETKKAHEEKRIAGSKVAWCLEKRADLVRSVLEPRDSRIFPFWYAPVIVMEAGELVVVPMRYHCRANGKPASYDRRYPGLYNARRDNLEGYWKDQFGRRHAVLVVSSFYENVARHDFEHRELRGGEKQANLVLHFNPQPPTVMLLACLWDRWQRPGSPDLYSFAAITDEPPPEVAATGHNRCVIPLRESNLRNWLLPEGQSLSELYALLDDRERPYYEHRRAA